MLRASFVLRPRSEAPFVRLIPRVVSVCRPADGEAVGGPAIKLYMETMIGSISRGP
jgi:hypothetical protein